MSGITRKEVALGPWRYMGRLINGLLRPTGYRAQLVRRSTPKRKVGYRRYQAAIEEYLEYFTTSEGIELPSSEKRLELLGQLEGATIQEGLCIIRELLRTFDIVGEVCEFGCAAGATSALMANEIMDTDKELWLFDSFKGLSKPGPKDELVDDVLGLGSLQAYEGAMSFTEDKVRKRLAGTGFPVSRTKVVAGFIEETVHSAALPGQICFAYVDFDFYEPIRVALQFIATRLSTGGRIVVDDYGFFSTGAKSAVDEFLSEHPGRFDLEVRTSRLASFAILRSKS